MVVGQFGEFEGRLNIPGAIHHVITRGLSGFRSVRFKGPKSACVHYKLRSQCLRHPERTQIRQVAYFIGRTEKGKDTFTERMKRKIDSAAGRALYAIRHQLYQMQHFFRITVKKPIVPNPSEPFG